jgi:hypothetical protein
MTTRRTFLLQLSRATGAVVLMPLVSRCGGATAVEEAAVGTIAPVPLVLPDGWDPIAYNRDRGNAGAIPESYWESINGPDGEAGHLGKHLPYVPDVDPTVVPDGFIAIMWGDSDKGHAQHPNAARGEANNFEGHWYNSIKIRKATDADSEELESTYVDWPGIGEESTGAYAVFGGGEISDDSGKHTIYLAALPSDVGPGDTIRIHAHCLTHGEYVDFVQI